jgi:glycosyltransferase involved in cell wall biosynthesis
LRVARGIQNKVLEAMAMQKAVVVAEAPAAGLGGTPNVHYRVAGDAESFARQVLELRDVELSRTIGSAAREHVLRHYQWEKNLAPIEHWLQQAPSSESVAARNLAHAS